MSNKSVGMMEREKVEQDTLVAVFLAKGGVIQQIDRNKSGRVEGQSYSAWSKKKPVTTSVLASPPDEDE
jgi:hypothetical protein